MVDRPTLIKLAEVLEETMIKTDKCETKVDQIIWYYCRTLWIHLQSILRNMKRKDE